MKVKNFYILIPLMIMLGCASEHTYPTGKGEIELSHHLIKGPVTDYKFNSYDEAKSFAEKQTKKLINKWDWSDHTNLIVHRVTLKPSSVESLIPFVISHWTLGAKVDYEIPRSAAQGKHSIALTCWDEMGKVSLKTKFEIDISQSKQTAELKKGLIVFALGFFFLSSGIGFSRMRNEDYPETGCLNIILIIGGLLGVIGGAIQIMKALFF